MDEALATQLAPVAGKWTLRLTHYGRRTGKPYDVTIWFIVDGDVIYLATADMQRQWTRNVQAHPQVALRLGDRTFTGTVSVVHDGKEAGHVMELLLRKYWYVRPLVWLSSWLGSSQKGGTFRVRVDQGA
jgi:deazaflavin-dependent oxidoreductase (nitroreductase family)